jgi:hypothetical protein
MSSDPPPSAASIDPVSSLDFSLDAPSELFDPPPERSSSLIAQLRSEYQQVDDSIRLKEQKEQEEERQRIVASLKSKHFSFHRSSATPLDSLSWARSADPVHMKFDSKTKVYFFDNENSLVVQMASSLANKYHYQHVECAVVSLEPLVDSSSVLSSHGLSPPSSFLLSSIQPNSHHFVLLTLTEQAKSALDNHRSSSSCSCFVHNSSVPVLSPLSVSSCLPSQQLYDTIDSFIKELPSVLELLLE